MLRGAVKDEHLGEYVYYVIRSESLATLIARHSLVNSSITVSILTARPSSVRQATKSYAQTCPLCSGLNLMHDPSLSQSLPLFGCLIGTFSPSRRQMRSTRL